MLKKVFGIISYFPDNDSAIHIETRKERSRRFRELLFKLDELWPNTDIIVIAQNWQDFQLPPTRNNITIYEYPKLGILGARRELRKKFLESHYDYLIMLDDDARISTDNPQAYIDEIDNHPDGIGVLRNHQAPLNLCAISKYIYNQIDMPDTDPENNEGFEDDLFVATCFNKFPDNAFMFTEGIITENSLNYKGPGACPSTWAREQKRNWDYLRNLTDTKIYQMQHPELYAKADSKVEPSIDAIIAYVNGSDTNWVKSYIKATNTHNPTPVRYRSWGTLKYLMRGIEKYMPFIRQIVLVVATPSQVPIWVNTEKVRIVYHEDFIPKKFLPTFNSCTIESFLWNIPNLADRVIYFNDDMFPVGQMSEIDFFTDNTPHIRFKDPESYSTKNIFVSQSRSGMDMVSAALGLHEYENGKILLPYHITQAITKNGLNRIKELCTDPIKKTITTIRTTKNVNQYIYAYYQYFTDDYVNLTVNYKYFEITEQSIKNIGNQLLAEDDCQMVCLNDSDKIKDYKKIRDQLLKYFDTKFPTKSRYEI